MQILYFILFFNNGYILTGDMSFQCFIINANNDIFAFSEGS